MTNPEVNLSRAQKLISYMTRELGLELPIKDDSLVPSASEMASGVGMSVRNTAEAMVILRKRKPPLLPDPKPENTSRRNSVSVSLFRGGKGLILERYSFMTGEEAYLAVVEKLGEEKVSEMGLDEKSVARIIVKQRVKAGNKRTDEERKIAHNAVHEPEVVKRGRVKFWSQVIDRLDQQGMKSPDSRLVWVDIWQRAENVEDGLKIAMQIAEERGGLQVTVEPEILPLVPLTLSPQVDPPQSELLIPESAIKPKVLKIIKEANLDTIPSSSEDWTILEEFFEAKESLKESPEKYRKFVEGINDLPQYLTPCFRAITEYLAHNMG